MLMESKRILTFLVFIGFYFNSWSGVEIGNTSFVPYQDLLTGFSLKYPEQWSFTQGHGFVSFFEVQESESQNGEPQFGSEVHVQARSFADVFNVEDLKKHIEFFHPDMEWEKVEVSGYLGFRSSTSKNPNGRGILYVLRDQEEVMSLRYDVKDQLEQLPIIDYLIRSLQIEEGF